MTKNRLHIHLQMQQSRILLTYVSHGSSYTLIYLYIYFLKPTTVLKKQEKIIVLEMLNL